MQRSQARLEANTRKSGTSRSCYYDGDTVEEDKSNYSHNNESVSGMHSRALSTVRSGPPWLSMEASTFSEYSYAGSRGTRLHTTEKSRNGPAPQS